MTTRTVKASEVRRGMRVRVVKESHGVVRTTEGGVVQGWRDETSVVIFDDGSSCVLSASHPVTVLAEPEPEWVEGAWYWVEKYDRRWLVRRVTDGWARSSSAAGAQPWWTDAQDPDVTVLGRVLIVDWPGDDVARAIERTYTPGGKWIATENTAAQIIADAIRTQGGAR